METSLTGKTVDKAMDYMEDKYSVEFTPVTYDMAGYLSTTDYIECYTDGMDPDHERAYVSVDSVDGELVFHDSYFSFIVRDEMEDMIGNIIATEFGAYKVFRGDINSVLPDTLGTDSDMADFYNEKPNYRMDVSIVINDDGTINEKNFENSVNNIVNDLIATEKNYTVRILVVRDDKYQQIDRYSQDIFMNEMNKRINGVDEGFITFLYCSSITDGNVNDTSAIFSGQ